ncbi:MAG: hypothetical protein QNJ55_17130 [Xenococcus sp. MO_188.B8]|nr:hypothetical protein [Xenococcus sp. MO_188.B8]
MNQADVPKIPMNELNCSLEVAQAIALIKSYSFDTNSNSTEQLVQKWLKSYQGTWVRLAAIEALYLGRYKAVSIEQIMEVWSRIGTPNIHFTEEFEVLICSKLPQHLIVSDSSLIATEASLVGKTVPDTKETLNSDCWQYSESRKLLKLLTGRTNELFSPSELLSPDNQSLQSPKTLSEVKNILKQENRDPEKATRKEKTESQPIGYNRSQIEKRSRNAFEVSASACNRRETSTIKNFHPILDRSSFFNKLKSLAINSDRLRVNH